VSECDCKALIIGRHCPNWGCSSIGKKAKFLLKMRVLVGKPEKEQLKDLRIYRRIILKLILEKEGRIAGVN